jgi:Mlc titration factor MtfA (ptsG expression regulator)
MLTWIGIFLLLLAIFGTPLVWLYQIIRDVTKYFFSDWYNINLPFIRVDAVTRSFLATNFQYYNKLSRTDQLTFERRVQKFIRLKDFQGREGLIITTGMRTLVAASAIQITFGFPSVYLHRFKEIILYPDSYYSTITKGYHQGEVNSAGVIVLSWKSLVQGYLNPYDGRNLGLHEMAHALKISDATSYAGFDFFDRKAFHHFIFYARGEMQLIVKGEASFFRQYASSNDHEFFAVAIENFFERPLEFSDFHPQMYTSLARLLNQDPLNSVQSQTRKEQLHN